MNVDWLFLFLPKHHFIFEIRLQNVDWGNLRFLLPVYGSLVSSNMFLLSREIGTVLFEGKSLYFRWVFAYFRIKQVLVM
jgi:hypothetical protein